MYMSVGRCGHLGYTRSRKVPESMRQLILAGGFTDDAEDSWLNLAEPVTDGMKAGGFIQSTGGGTRPGRLKTRMR